MAQTIKIKRSATSGNKLTGSNSVAGEIGMNTADKSLYIQTGSTDSSVVTIYDDSILHLDDTNNRVGIGTTSPTYHLHVDAGNTNTTALFKSDGVANVVVSGGNNRGSFVVQHSGTTTGAVISKDGGGLEFGVGANYATNVGMTLDSSGNLSTGQVTSDDKFTVSTSDWYQFTPGTMSATVGSYGMGNGNNAALRQLTFHVPNIAAYSNTGTVPSFGWYSNGADLLMKLESSSGNLTVKGNIVTDSNSTVIAARKIAARDTSGLAIATSDGTERIAVLNSGAVRFNNAFVFPTAIGSAGQVLKVPSSGTTLYWADESAASTSTLMSDADGDTKIQVEESADEDKIRFDTAGTERMIITDAGNVGIGTTSPTSKLEVHGTTTLKSQLDFLSPDGTDTISASMLNTDTLSFTGDSGQLFSITDSSSGTIFSVNDISGVPSIEVEDDGTIRLAETFGNVGIGLETPSKKLEVSGDFAVTTSTSSNAAYIRNSGTGAALVVNQQGTGDILRVDDNSTTKLVVKDGGRVGIGTASPGYDLDVNGQIHGTAVYVDGYINHTGDSDTYIQYSTDTIILSAGAQETYFKGDGNVGIGTSSPATNLEVAGSAAKLRITDTRDQTFTVGDIMSSIEFDSDDTSGGAGTSSEPRAAINMYAATTFGSSTGLSFHTKSDITSYPTKQMVITNLGRVGIATDSPSDPLHVVGAIRSEGSTTSKYLKVAGGNTGNFIDSHGNDLYLRPNGTTGQALVVRQGGTTEVNSTLTVKPADIGGVTPPTLTAGQLTNSYQVGLSSSLHLSMKVTSSSGNFYWYPTSSTPIAILRQNGDFTLGSTNADNYVNTGSYFKPDTSGKFLAVTGSAHGGFLMLESSTVTDNDQIGGVFFTASAGQSDAHRQVAGIDAIVDAHSTNTALSGADLRFFTKNVGSGLSDPRMTIRSSGQVGIGTTTPGVPLDVNGVIRAVAGDAATSAYSITSNGGDLVLKAGADDVVLRTGGSGSEGIYFQDGAQDTKMFINAENGQVGIGTTSPSYNLDIQTTTGTGLNVTDDNDWATIRVDGGGGTDNVLELTNYGNTGSGSIIRTTGSGHLRLYAGNTEAIRIDGSNQKVGIGVTLPAENLDVTGAVKFRGSSADSTVMHLGRYSDNANTSLVEVICEDTSYDKLENYMKRYGSHFEWTRTSPAGKVAVMHVYSGGGDAKLDLWHQPNTSNSAVERRVRLFTNGASYLNGGNVGIGTSSPSHKLHVVGDIGVNDNNKIKLGGSGDLELYHSATDSYIINNTGHTYLRSDEDNKDVIIQARLGTGGNLAAYFIADSSDQAAKLYHGGYQKFATISNGIRVSSNNYGRIQISDTDNTGLDAFLDKSGINLNITSRFNTGHGGITLRRYNGSTTLTSFAVDEIGDSKFYRDNGSTIGAVFDASTGRFGIGTTTPSEALHVAGDVQIDGSVNTGSNVALLVGGSGNSTIKTRHVDGKDYQSTSDGTLHLNYYVTDNVSIASGGGKVQIGSGVPLARLQVEEAGIDTLTTSTSSASQVAIDTFNKGHFRSAEFTIQVTNTTTSKYHLTKILLIHDGTTPNITEYGTIFTGTAAEATFDADISGNNVRLLATPASANSMTFKVVRHCITV